MFFSFSLSFLSFLSSPFSLSFLSFISCLLRCCCCYCHYRCLLHSCCRYSRCCCLSFRLLQHLLFYYEFSFPSLFFLLRYLLSSCHRPSLCCLLRYCCLCGFVLLSFLHLLCLSF